MRRGLRHWVDRKVRGLLPFGGFCRPIRWQWLTFPISGRGVLTSLIQARMCALNNLSCYLFSLLLPHLYSNQPSFLSTTLFFCGPKALSITLSPLVINLYFLCMEKTFYHPFLILTVHFSAAICQTSGSPWPSLFHSPDCLKICIVRWGLPP